MQRRIRTDYRDIPFHFDGKKAEMLELCRIELEVHWARRWQSLCKDFFRADMPQVFLIIDTPTTAPSLECVSLLSKILDTSPNWKALPFTISLAGISKRNPFELTVVEYIYRYVVQIWLVCISFCVWQGRVWKLNGDGYCLKFILI